MSKSIHKTVTFLLILCLATFLGVSVSFAATPKLSTKTASVYVNHTITLKVKNKGKKAVTWKSSKPSVATVSQAGKVRGIKKGKATISAKVGSKTLKCTVSVKVRKVKTVKISKTTATLYTNKTLKLKTTVTPKNASIKSMKWKSSNKNVATVSGGVVKPLKAGKVTISATTKDGTKKTVKCKITVKENQQDAFIPTYKLNIGETPSVMYLGETVSIPYSVESNVKGGDTVDVLSSSPAIYGNASEGKITLHTTTILTADNVVVGIYYGSNQKYEFKVSVKNIYDVYMEKWRKDLVTKLGLSSMSVQKRLTIISSYISENYPHKSALSGIVGKASTFCPDLAKDYPTKYYLGGDCLDSTMEIIAFAKMFGISENNCQVVYPNEGTGPEEYRTHKAAQITIGSSTYVFDCGYGGLPPRAWTVINRTTGACVGYEKDSEYCCRSTYDETMNFGFHELTFPNGF